MQIAYNIRFRCGDSMHFSRIVILDASLDAEVHAALMAMGFNKFLSFVGTPWEVEEIEPFDVVD